MRTPYRRACFSVTTSHLRWAEGGGGIFLDYRTARKRWSEVTDLILIVLCIYNNNIFQYIFNKPSLTQEDVNALGKCRKESAFFVSDTVGLQQIRFPFLSQFLRKFGMNYKHLDEFKSRFERDRPELLEGLNVSTLQVHLTVKWDYMQGKGLWLLANCYCN